MAERFKALVLKTIVRLLHQGFESLFILNPVVEVVKWYTR